MIATALSLAWTSAWVTSAVAAAIGMAYNARPIAKLYRDTAGTRIWARLRLCLVGQLIMAYLWAVVGLAVSPAVALAAAWVSWSF